MLSEYSASSRTNGQTHNSINFAMDRYLPDGGSSCDADRPPGSSLYLLSSGNSDTLSRVFLY